MEIRNLAVEFRHVAIELVDEYGVMAFMKPGGSFSILRI